MKYEINRSLIMMLESVATNTTREIRNLCLHTLNQHWENMGKMKRMFIRILILRGKCQYPKSTWIGSFWALKIPRNYPWQHRWKSYHVTGWELTCYPSNECSLCLSSVTGACEASPSRVSDQLTRSYWSLTSYVNKHPIKHSKNLI